MWDLVSCFLRRVECFILIRKSRSGSFQKKKSESRGGACLLFRKPLHVYAFGWHRKSCKILISRSAGVTNFFGERKCLSRKWSFCRGRTLDSKHEVRSRCRRAWPRSHVFYKFLVPPKSPKTNMHLQEVVVLSRQNARFQTRSEVVGDGSLASKSCVL